jgi:outer membrane protein OmpA-like peptidoglycan-associated protein
MKQKELNEENKEITNKAYELYEKHGFKDGNDFVDWLEAEQQMGTQARSLRRKQMQNILYAIVGLLCVIVAVLFIMLFRHSPKVELSERNLSDLKVMMLVLDQKADEAIVAFGDTHFDYNKSTLTNAAKTQLDKNVQVLEENPKMKVRMAGYTSAQGTEDSNQELSEERANAVRSYLIEKGIAPGRITVIGYGRTKPAMYEVSPGDINTKEAKANMRVLFEVVVK